MLCNKLHASTLRIDPAIRTNRPAWAREVPGHPWTALPLMFTLTVSPARVIRPLVHDSTEVQRASQGYQVCKRNCACDTGNSASGVFAVTEWTYPEFGPVAVPERIWNVNVVAARHGKIQPMLKLFGEVIAERRIEIIGYAQIPAKTGCDNCTESGYHTYADQER